MSQSGTYNESGGGGGDSVQGLLCDNAVVVTPNPITHDITIHGGTGVTTSGNAGDYTVTINATGSGTTWNNISSNQTLAVDNNYMCTGGGTLNLLLPALSAFGDTIVIVLDGSTGFVVTQASGQQIRIGKLTSTLGASGSVASTFRGDSIELVCKTANTLWTVYDSIGNLVVN